MQIPVMFSQIVPPLVRINQGIFISFDKFGEKNRTPSNIYSYLLDPAWFMVPISRNTQFHATIKLFLDIYMY